LKAQPAPESQLAYNGLNVMRVLAHDPAERFATADEMKQALEAIDEQHHEFSATPFWQKRNPS
jgi:hypothetical protein